MSNPPTRYPIAQMKGDGQSGGSWTGGPYRVVLHTTETEGLPSYGGGASAPHLTYQPKDRTWIQHTPLDRAARALKNLSGGVETNRRRALQVEIVAYSDKSVADQAPSRRLWIGNLDDNGYADLAQFIDWCAANFDVAKTCRMPRPKPQFGTNSPARMTGAAWNDFDGVCGHFEVPENDHWDPGALDIARLVSSTPAPAPPDPGDDDMPTADEIRQIVRDEINAALKPDDDDVSRASKSMWNHGGKIRRATGKDDAQRVLIDIHDAVIDIHDAVAKS